MKAITTKLESVANIRVGYQARSGIQESSEGTHWLIQGKDFDFNHFLQSIKLVKFVPDRKPELYAVQKDDILFMARGVGHYASHVEENLKDTLVSGSFYIIRVSKTGVLIPAYLAWWLNQPNAQTYFQAQASGTHIPFVSKAALCQMKIKIPPISIQQKIVEVIKLWRLEMTLRDRLSQYRSRLIDSVCTRATQ